MNGRQATDTTSVVVGLSVPCFLSRRNREKDKGRTCHFASSPSSTSSVLSPSSLRLLRLFVSFVSSSPSSLRPLRYWHQCILIQQCHKAQPIPLPPSRTTPFTGQYIGREYP